MRKRDVGRVSATACNQREILKTRNRSSDKAHAKPDLGGFGPLVPSPSPRSPSPRLRGEGRGEGAFPQAQTRGEAPSPVLHPGSAGVSPALSFPDAGEPPALPEGDLSPRAGRGG